MKLKTSIIILLSCTAILGDASVYAAADTKPSSSNTSPAINQDNFKPSMADFLKDLDLSKKQLAQIKALQEKSEVNSVLLQRTGLSSENIFAPKVDWLKVDQSTVNFFASDAVHWMKFSNNYRIIFHQYLNAKQQKKVIKEASAEEGNIADYGTNGIMMALTDAPKLLQQFTEKPEPAINDRHLEAKKVAIEKPLFEFEEAFLKEMNLSQAQFDQIAALQKTRIEDIKKFFDNFAVLEKSMIDPRIDQATIDQLIVINTALITNVMMAKPHIFNAIFYQVLNKEQQKKIMEKPSMNNEITGYNVMAIIGNASIDRAIKKHKVEDSVAKK